MPETFLKKWEEFEYKHTSITVFIMLVTLLTLNTALGAAVLSWFTSIGLLAALLAVL